MIYLSMYISLLCTFDIALSIWMPHTKYLIQYTKDFKHNVAGGGAGGGNGNGSGTRNEK